MHAGIHAGQGLIFVSPPEGRHGSAPWPAGRSAPRSRRCRRQRPREPVAADVQEGEQRGRLVAVGQRAAEGVAAQAEAADGAAVDLWQGAWDGPCSSVTVSEA